MDANILNILLFLPLPHRQFRHARIVDKIIRIWRIGKWSRRKNKKIKWGGLSGGWMISTFTILFAFIFD